MEAFTLCDCDNITNSYMAHYEQNQITVANRTVLAGLYVDQGPFTPCDFMIATAFYFPPIFDCMEFDFIVVFHDKHFC